MGSPDEENWLATVRVYYNILELIDNLHTSSRTAARLGRLDLGERYLDDIKELQHEAQSYKHLIDHNIPQKKSA